MLILAYIPLVFGTSEARPPLLGCNSSPPSGNKLSISGQYSQKKKNDGRQVRNQSVLQYKPTGGSQQTGAFHCSRVVRALLVLCSYDARTILVRCSYGARTVESPNCPLRPMLLPRATPGCIGRFRAVLFAYQGCPDAILEPCSLPFSLFVRCSYCACTMPVRCRYFRYTPTNPGPNRGLPGPRPRPDSKDINTGIKIRHSYLISQIQQVGCSARGRRWC